MANCKLTLKKNGLHVQSQSNDPHFHSLVDLPKGWKRMVIKADFRGRANGQVFWATQNQSYDSNQSVSFDARGKLGQETSIVTYFRSDQPVTSLRIDPLSRKGSMRIVSIVVTDDEPPASQATPVSKIKVAEGYKVELLYSVPKKEQGSWVAMTTDPKGRLIASDQYGALYRMTPPPIGSDDAPEVEKLSAKIGMAQGMLCAFDSLYVVVNGRPENNPAGLYRLKDTNGDDQYDEVKLLREFKGGGEHGPHAVILSPDGKSLYTCGGNHTEIPNPETSRVPTNWGEDQLLPRMWDAGGHAVGKMAPGGWIAKTDPDGKQFELISSGFRNEYDIAFNPEGDLFTYDADMEWDIGSPWYRPTRVNHATSGAEFGWRSGTGKFPVFYPDSLNSVVDIGPGCPTGIAFGTGAKFSQKYQKALFISDWSYGIIYAVHMKQDGSTYAGQQEQFVSAPALQVTDLVVNPKDGSLYFAIGGRRTQSGVYRVTYVGKESTAPAAKEKLNELHVQRRELEELHKKVGKSAVEKAWPFLNHKDRYLRYAARIAIEHQPVELWADLALSEEKTQASIEAIIALARNGKPEHQGPAIAALSKINYGELTENHRLQLLRTYGLVLIRLSKQTKVDNQQRFEVSDEIRTAVAATFDSHYPAKSVNENLELCRILCAVDSKTAAIKTLKLLENAPTQEEQVHYSLCLRVVKNGWTPETHSAYFNWFIDAGALQGGHSFSLFLRNIRNEAIANLSAEEKTALKDVLSKKPVDIDPYAELKARPFVKNWTSKELVELVKNDKGERDLVNGKQLFGVATCYKCHRFEGFGGMVGPDLTAVGRRFNIESLVESLIEPSKVVSDQYEATMFELDNGRTITGRVANLNGKNYMVQEDMSRPGKLTRVNVDMIDSMTPSPNSMMPSGLLDNLSKEEILDLIAYIRSAQVTAQVPKTAAVPNRTNQKTRSQPVSKVIKKKLNDPSRADRPNVVFIISDDQTWTDYSFMGHKTIKTPRLDQLARQSVTFTRGYVPVSLCRPSLATMITGLYPHQHGITGNDPAKLKGKGKEFQQKYQLLRNQLIAKIDTLETIPKRLAEVGYKSHQSGKWWEGNYSRGGFDEGMTHGDPSRGGRHGDEGLKIGRKGLKPVLDFIETNAKDPFFIWYAPFLPHTPHNPPKRLLDKYKKDGRPLPLAKYYAMCEWFDETCGELLDQLDRVGVADNTIVVYVTDNGWIQRTSKTKVPAKWFTSFAPGSKQSPLDGGLRTPIMIRWPNKFTPVMDKTTLVSSLDIAPTIYKACGIKSKVELPGINLIPICEGEKSTRSTIYGEIFAHDIADLDNPKKSLVYRWVIDGNKKLIKKYDGQIGRYKPIHQDFPKEPQLFDLSKDPLETTNLADESTRKRLLNLLEEFDKKAILSTAKPN